MKELTMLKPSKVREVTYVTAVISHFKEDGSVMDGSHRIYFKFKDFSQHSVEKSSIAFSHGKPITSL
jgi:nucleoside diphosphate kinase